MARRPKRSSSRRRAPKKTRETRSADVVEMLGLEAILRPHDDATARLRARLRKSIARNPGVVVGDRVQYRSIVDPNAEADGPDAVIEGVDERRNLLIRSGFQGVQRLVGANLDFAVIVVSPSDPPLRLGLVDRYVAATRACGVTPAICLNKSDLDTDEVAWEALAIYPDLGIPVVRTHVVDDRFEIAELAVLLQGQRSIFVGHSGVGKSSLAKCLIPGLERAVGAINETIGRGRHTTTVATLLQLPNGGELVDTPGIRSFGLHGVEAKALHTCYPEYVDLGERCKFRGCTHVHEPACAVMDAVESDKLDAGRYERYLDILESL